MFIFGHLYKYQKWLGYGKASISQRFTRFKFISTIKHMTRDSGLIGKQVSYCFLRIKSSWML